MYTFMNKVSISSTTTDSHICLYKFQQIQYLQYLQYHLHRMYKHCEQLKKPEGVPSVPTVSALPQYVGNEM